MKKKIVPLFFIKNRDTPLVIKKKEIMQIRSVLIIYFIDGSENIARGIFKTRNRYINKRW